MSWKRTRAKKALMEIFPIVTSENSILLYKEVEDKIHLRYTYMQTTIKKSDMNKYLEPVVTDGKIEEVTPELSAYLDDVFKKAQKKK